MNKGKGLYEIRTANSGKCLEVESSSLVKNANILQVYNINLNHFLIILNKYNYHN